MDIIMEHTKKYKLADLKIGMQPTPDGLGGSFNTFASFTLDNIKAPFQNVRVKIDTGCSISTIPLAKFKH